MKNNLNYGRCLTYSEYAKLLADLYSALPPIPSKEEEARVRREELDITINYRLGCGFPGSRREALWRIQQRIEKKRIRLIFKYIIRRLFPTFFARSVNKIANFMVDEYAQVLTEEELKCYFGEEEVKGPAIPINMDNIKK